MIENVFLLYLVTKNLIELVPLLPIIIFISKPIKQDYGQKYEGN